MSTRISDKLAKAFDAALDKHAGGDKVGWDVGILPANNGQLVHILTMVCPSPLLGQVIQISAVIPNGFEVTEDDCDNMVLNALEQIATQRSQILASTSGPAINGGTTYDEQQNIIKFPGGGN